MDFTDIWLCRGRSKRLPFLPMLALVTAMLMAAPSGAAARTVLLVTTTTGFRHDSIETAEKVIERLGRSSGAFEVDLASVPPPAKPGPAPTPEQSASSDAQQAAYLSKVRAVLAEKMNTTALKRYDAIIFASTTGDLPLPDADAFVRWVRDGGAFIGIHSASDTLHGIRPYVEMLGGEFDYHREQVAIEAINRDQAHPATRHLGKTWNLDGRPEEIYIFKNYRPEAVHELLVLDHHPNTGEAGHFALAWCRPFGRGRVFYTALGHNEHLWTMPAFQQHVLGGISWALNLDEPSAALKAR